MIFNALVPARVQPVKDRVGVVINTPANIAFTITNIADVGQISNFTWKFRALDFDTYVSINSTLISDDHLSLRLPEVQLNDRGLYRISVTSEAGLVYSTVILDVFG